MKCKNKLLTFCSNQKCVYIFQCAVLNTYVLLIQIKAGIEGNLRACVYKWSYVSACMYLPPQAYSLMEEMRRRVPSVNLAYYLDIRTIEAIHRALGIPVGRGVGAEVMLQRTLQEEEEEEEESDESIGEEDD